MTRSLVFYSFLGLAALSAGCRSHQPDVLYVPKESTPVYTISPDLLGSWEGRLADYSDKGAPATYACTLEIRKTGTAVLRGFRNQEISVSSSMPIAPDRINFNFTFNDRSEQWLETNLLSKNEIYVVMEFGSSPADFKKSSAILRRKD